MSRHLIFLRQPEGEECGARGKSWYSCYRPKFEPCCIALLSSAIVVTGVAFLHYALHKDGIYLSLACIPSRIHSNDWVNLFWSMLVVDFTIKHVTMLLKAIVIAWSPQKTGIFSRVCTCFEVNVLRKCVTLVLVIVEHLSCLY